MRSLSRQSSCFSPLQNDKRLSPGLSTATPRNGDTESRCNKRQRGRHPPRVRGVRGDVAAREYWGARGSQGARGILRCMGARSAPGSRAAGGVPWCRWGPGLQVGYCGARGVPGLQMGSRGAGGVPGCRWGTVVHVGSPGCRWVLGCGGAGTHEVRTALGDPGMQESPGVGAGPGARAHGASPNPGREPGGSRASAPRPPRSPAQRRKRWAPTLGKKRRAARAGKRTDRSRPGGPGAPAHPAGAPWADTGKVPERGRRPAPLRPPPAPSRRRRAHGAGPALRSGRAYTDKWAGPRAGGGIRGRRRRVGGASRRVRRAGHAPCRSPAPARACLLPTRRRAPGGKGRRPRTQPAGGWPLPGAGGPAVRGPHPRAVPRRVRLEPCL
nr:collagen alpha-1(I) chain-like isoform X1 [Equus caballus]XP_023494301.1 collagen alpha-1(I) chain-like isoform X1 [Equus caballus]